MRWINFIHLYQPATLDTELIIEAAEKSYRRIIKALKKNPDVRFTMNIQACLLNSLLELGYDDLLNDIRTLVTRGQVELVGSAAYHPIAPLIPETELQVQITLQEEALRTHFGNDLRLRGFFLPELAYSTSSARVIKRLGYEWILLDEISANGALNHIDTTRPYRDTTSDLTVVFRNREASQSYVPKQVAALLAAGATDTVVTATDAELYGLRHEDVSGAFEKLIKTNGLTTQTISEFIDKSPQPQPVTPAPSTWESTERELQRHIPYALWQHPRNKVQKKIWELARLALETQSRHPDDSQAQWVTWHLRRGLASCTFWWASANVMPINALVAWSPDEIERGVEELIKSIRALDDVITRATKIRAEKLYITIKRLIWKKHWTYYWKK